MLLSYVHNSTPKPNQMQAELIEKENLNAIRFINKEVLSSQQDIASRSTGLIRALVLGNAHHGKVKLSFKTKHNETLSVYTTVWTVAGNYITLKANRFIPIHAITSIEF
jgi:hypothetical protein